MLIPALSNIDECINLSNQIIGIVEESYNEGVKARGDVMLFWIADKMNKLKMEENSNG